MIRPQCGIAIHGTHSVKNGTTRIRAVDIKTDKKLFNNDIPNSTINTGEFPGIVEAAKYIIKHNFSPAIIYTDSITAISWFQAKKTASKKRCPELQRAEIFLKAFSATLETIEVRHWDKEAWGETPAAYGEK